MKNSLIIAASFFMLFFISCKKQDNIMMVDKIQNDNALLVKAKSFYSENSVKSELTNSVKWKNSKVYIIDGMKFLIVPLSIKGESVREQKVATSRNIIFYENTSAGMNASIVEIIAESSTLPQGNIDKIIISALKNEFLYKNEIPLGIQASAIFYDLNNVWQNSFQSKNGIWKKVKIQTEMKYIPTTNLVVHL